MTVAPEAEQEIVVGTVAGVITKAADKWQVEVAVEGSQYTRKLWTKDPQVAGQMQTMIGQHLSFLCGVSHWTNSQNQQVRSLWLNGFGQPGQQPVQQQQPVIPQPQPVGQAQAGFIPQQPVAAQPVQQAQQAVQQAIQQGIVQPQPPSAYEKDQRIMREAATKVAVKLLDHIAEDQRTFANLVAISERLVSYYEEGVSWPQADGDGAPPPHTDDDIPF